MTGSSEQEVLKPACREAEDFEIFFKGDIRKQSGVHENVEDPEGLEAKISRSEAKQAYLEAITYCGRCTVSSECLNTALDNGEKWGIWGGLTTSQRSEIIKKQAA